MRIAEKNIVVKGRHWQLPARFKRIGLVVVLLALVGIVVSKMFMNDHQLAKVTLSYFVLAGLLVASLSKEPIEDELMVHLRATSYSLAFIAGVVYAIVQPLVNYLVWIFIEIDNTGLIELTVAQVLFFMLFIQLGYFELSKRRHQ